MEISELQTKYTQLGGNPSDLEGIRDPSMIQLMVSMQAELSDTQDKKEETEPELTDLEKLQELRTRDTSNLTLDTDPYRTYQNEKIQIENKIRATLGLEPRPLEVMDTQLQILLQLDQWKLGHSCKDFLGKYLKKSLQESELRHRLESMIQNHTLKQMSEEKQIDFLERSSKTLEKLSRIPPMTALQGDLVKRNPRYTMWKHEVLELKKTLETQIKVEDSWQRDPSIDFKKDERSSLYKLYEKVQKLCERGGIE